MSAPKVGLVGPAAPPLLHQPAPQLQAQFGCLHLRAALNSLQLSLQHKASWHQGHKVGHYHKGQVNIDQSNDSQTEIPNYSQDITKAATFIIGACTGWQLGIVERSNIMDYAKQVYAKQGFDPNTVDWARAIEIARTIDKQQGLDCIN